MRDVCIMHFTLIITHNIAAQRTQADGISFM